MTLSEQDFYDRLAIFFDVMTDWQGRLAYEMPFLTGLLARAGTRVLDAACGTGWHSIALAGAGYRVTGADISPVMIARARENAQRERSAATFVTSDFAGLPRAAGTGYDALLCLGNSLVHVLTQSDLQCSLAAMAACLRPGGLLVLHNLNYDRRMVEKPRWFQVNSGVMDDRETLVWRFADYGADGMISFNIAVFQKSVEGGWTVQVQSTLQRPWQARELEQHVQKAGFRDVALYGNLAGEPFVASASGDLVLAAHRAP